MDFQTKIDKLLKAKAIARWKLAQITGINSTLERAYQENREMRPSTTLKLLEGLKVSPHWWETGTGEMFLEEPKKGPPMVTKPAKDWLELNTRLAHQQELLSRALENVTKLTEIVDRLTMRLEAAEQERNLLAHGIKPPKEKNPGQQ